MWCRWCQCSSCLWTCAFLTKPVPGRFMFSVAVAGGGAFAAPSDRLLLEYVKAVRFWVSVLDVRLDNVLSLRPGFCAEAVGFSRRTSLARSLAQHRSLAV